MERVILIEKVTFDTGSRLRFSHAIIWGRVFHAEGTASAKTKAEGGARVGLKQRE